ncbi:DMT family transporter [Neoroseomonas soli]|uniref:DMT family transporter n=1 Tax=Neoroseomonas soli TaxID=1081025 RepID=A0A9X9WXM1_9PROT|nr:DMT family transporter [Neoroseomonas soli]MBR0671900.1 DMT family transporter [Neoroseomonas soli]
MSATGAAARDRRKGWAAALGVLAIWVGFQLVGRVAVRQDFTPWDIGALRYAGAFLLAAPIAWRVGVPRIPPVRFAAVMATAGFGFPLCAYLGFAHAPAAHGAVIMSAGLPVATTILAWALLREAAGRRRLASLGAVVLAALLLAADGRASPPGAWIGDLFYAAASFCWAGYTLLVRRWRLPALGTTLLIALAGAPVFLPVWWLALPSNMAAAPPGEALFQMVYQGMLASVTAGFLYTTAVARIGPGPTTLVGALVPGLVALAAWPLLGEPLGLPGMAGVVLAMGGMALGVARAR